MKKLTARFPDPVLDVVQVASQLLNMTDGLLHVVMVAIRCIVDVPAWDSATGYIS